MEQNRRIEELIQISKRLGLPYIYELKDDVEPVLVVDFQVLHEWEKQQHNGEIHTQN